MRSLRHIVLRGAIALGLVFGAVGGADAQIRMGVAGPMTGPSAAYGAQLKTGAEQAVADINAEGGILGRKIVLETGDDAFDPKQGLSVARKFVGDHVTLVVGHFNSGVTIPASEVYAKKGILFVTPASTNPMVTERGLWNAFRTCSRDDQQGQVWADYAISHFKDKKIAVVHDKTPYGEGIAAAARKSLRAAGVKEVLYAGVAPGGKDYSALVSRIATSGADLLMWGGLSTEGGLIVRQMRDRGLQTVMMSGDGITSDTFATVGGDGVVGTLMSFGPDPRRNPAAAEVVAALEARGIDPEGYTLYAYAAVQIMAQAAEAARSTNPRLLAKAMHSGKAFKTVLGDIAYDRKGDRMTADYAMYTWKKLPDGRVTYSVD